MSDRREYYKKWREKNRESIREKDKIRHTKKVMGSPYYLERYKKWVFYGVRFGYLERFQDDMMYQKDFDKCLEMIDDYRYEEPDRIN